MAGSFGVVSTPPVLSSAVFNSAFTGLLLRFSKDTDQGSSALLSVTAPPCVRLLGRATLAAVGSGALCRWQSLARLQVLFGSSPTLLPGFNVTLLGGWLKSADLTSSASSESMLWSAVPSPSPSSVPPVVISCAGARVLGHCAALQLDLSASSGLGARPATVQWGLISVQPVATAPQFPADGIAALNAVLASQSWPNSNSLQLFIGASLLPAGTFD